MSFRDNEAKRRYELEHDGGVSFADYRDERDGRRALTHFETPEQLRGKGGAGKLMLAILGDARAKKQPLRARCAYAETYLERHREAADVMISGAQ